MLDSFFKFATENPWLTFFMLLIAGQTLVGVVKWTACIIHGIPPNTEIDDDE